MTQTLTFDVPEMHCGACTGRVERILKAQQGVTEAAANLAARRVRVSYDAPAAPAALAEALARAGYPVTQASTRLEIEGMTCASCTGRVERALAAVPGVMTANVNLALHRADVSYAAGATSPDELAAVVTRAGYPSHPQTETSAETPDRDAEAARDLRGRMVLAAVLTLPVVVLAMGGHLVPAFHHWQMDRLGMTGGAMIQFVLTAAVLAGPGRIFLRLGLPALWRGAPEMNALVALGSLAAFAYSTVATFAPALLPEGAREVYFEAAATIVTLILVGRWLEARARGQAGAAIRRLVELAPATAQVERAAGVVELPVGQIVPGDVLRLAPGEKVALDGEVVEGTGFVDESMLTGEPAPVAKAPGARLTGGTLNGTSALRYRVTATGADTVLARIVRLVEEAQGGKLPVQALVDRVTRVFVPVVMALSALTFGLWMLVGPDPRLSHALVAAISVLIIACPCAMGLATPVSILVGTGRAAEKGVFFRKGEALQRLAEARIVAFDKTGTLTEGKPRLTDLVTTGDEAQVLTLTAAAEARSEHPLAAAILTEARARGLTLPEAESVTALPGRGLSARVAGHLVEIAAARDLAAEDAPVLAQAAGRLAAEGKTTVAVRIDGALVAVLALSDPPKETAAAAVAALVGLGLEPVMISGDSPQAAGAVAARLGIGTVIAGVLPEGKVAAVADLKSRGAVLFVGDGINDAPALAAADTGIAIGTGTDVAIEAAEVVLMSGDPRGVAEAVKLSRATLRNIRQNLFWAFGYNAALIPVAMGVLYPVNGTLLSPMLAAGAMAFSSVFVVTNALRLRRA